MSNLAADWLRGLIGTFDWLAGATGYTCCDIITDMPVCCTDNLINERTHVAHRGGSERDDEEHGEIWTSRPTRVLYV